MTDRAAVVLCFAAALACVAVEARTLYKLVGRDGRVTYSDAVPEGWQGQVTAIETDPAPAPPLPKSVDPVPAKAKDADTSQKRRKARTELEANLRAAQARADTARKARADAEAPRPEDMQVVQRRYPPLQRGQNPPRANCFNAVDPANGVLSMVCPVQVPGEKHYDRLKRLDEDVANAEESLRDAERAYRRGTD